jgi:hypothetical protein
VSANGRSVSAASRASRYETFLNCSSCCDTQWMTIETTFPEKVTCPEEADDCLFASNRNDGELNLSFSDIENQSETSPCKKAISSFSNFNIVFPPPTLARKFLGSNEALPLLLKTALLLLLTDALPVNKSCCQNSQFHCLKWYDTVLSQLSQ